MTTRHVDVSAEGALSYAKLLELVRVVETLDLGGHLLAKRFYDWIDANIVEVGVFHEDTHEALMEFRRVGYPSGLIEHRRRALAATLAQQLLLHVHEDVTETLYGVRRTQKAYLLSDRKRAGEVSHGD